MIAAPTDRWKLGLFVVLAVIVGVGALFWIGARRLNRESVEVVTFFQEPVGGLEEGSAVKMRGVSVGIVDTITIAPDRRSVEVRASIYSDVLAMLGVDPEDPGSGRIGPDDLRTQVAIAGITGTKYVLVDFFPLAEHPLPLLSFDPGDRYLPSVPSTLKNLEDGLNLIVEAVPEVTGELNAFLRVSRERLEALDTGELSRSATALLELAHERLAALDTGRLTAAGVEALEALRDLLRGLEAADGPVATTAAGWLAAARRLEAVISEVDASATAGSLREASAAVTGLARSAGGTTNELARDLRAFREAMEAVRALAELLERDPGALLRGRAHNP
ncbi:MAG: MlaD family protein [Planctomycetota bacterium]|jgi:paraquat-inducible protein B|nr:MlaD family protein [Planctomycetota bacterium]MDP6763849.1 MlaD family protein [Planctomycetota bacterium]MDP6987917.1 MlaD family protein [Planctomycetota bacterium]